MLVATPGNPTRITWNGVVEEQELVRARFNELMSTNSYMAYQTTDVGKPSQRHERISVFEPQAERITLTPRIVGGNA
jgi:hypothetical protein